MSWRLFLDDLRDPQKVYNRDDLIVARTSEEAEALVTQLGAPEWIGFDHDLGEIKTGHYFALWLIEQELDGNIRLPDNFTYNVHSANPVGAENIRKLLENYLANRKTI